MVFMRRASVPARPGAARHPIHRRPVGALASGRSPWIRDSSAGRTRAAGGGVMTAFVAGPFFAAAGLLGAAGSLKVAPARARPPRRCAPPACRARVGRRPARSSGRPARRLVEIAMAVAALVGRRVAGRGSGGACYLGFAVRSSARLLRAAGAARRAGASAPTSRTGRRRVHVGGERGASRSSRALAVVWPTAGIA